MRFTYLLIFFTAAVIVSVNSQDRPITPVSEILKELGTIPQAPSQSFQTEPISVSVKETENPDVHVVQSGENPWTIAKKYGVSMDELIKINEIGNSRDLKIGQELKIPAKVSPSNPAAEATNNSSDKPEFDSKGYDVYSIKNGDNPWTIARKLKVNYEALLEINDIENPRDLKIGQMLRVPKPGQKPMSTIASEDEEGFIGPRQKDAVETPFDADGHQVHSVKSGENPWTIARKLQVDYKELIELNQIDNPKDIKVGLKLKIPKKG